MNTKSFYIGCLSWLLIALACTESSVRVAKEETALPKLFPDYTGVTIPRNIAPLNFKLCEEADQAKAVFSSDTYTFEITTSTGSFDIPASRWKELLESATGKEIQVKLLARNQGKWTGYPSFTLHVAEEPIDPYLVYRLIEPGYELWNRMGIYQRNLEDYTETPIMENKMSGHNCMNCHSFCMQNPDQMLFHMRGTYPCTILIEGDRVEKLNTKTPETISPLVYPSWHPSGRYIAFSVNQTHQAFHANDKNRIEVFDEASDVVVYDKEKHEIVTASHLSSSGAFETFPTFSPDGKTLYFCTAEARPIPEEYDSVKYHICSVSFDPEQRRFGSRTDTLYNAHTGGRSASFPRISPDGKYLLYTLSGYGNFSIWHKDADLYMLNLATKQVYPLEEANSPDVESYHSWSSNSRWIVFSSRRIDGLYTRPYLAYIDAEGKAAKPVLLPQQDPDFYHTLMKSYNIPELLTGKVKSQGRKIGLTAKKQKGIDVKFAGSH